MAKNTPSFQFYPADFLVGTTLMSATACGIYIRLLCHQWSSLKLPTDRVAIAKLGGVSIAELNEVWDEISDKFEVSDDGFMRNARLSKTLEDSILLRKKRAEIGQKGGLAKANNLLKQKRSKGRQKTEDRSQKKEDPKYEAWIVPEHLDCPEVRGELESFRRMRKRIGKPIKSLANSSRVLKQFESKEQLLRALDVVIGNEWQGLKVEYGNVANRKTGTPKLSPNAAGFKRRLENGELGKW